MSRNIRRLAATVNEKTAPPSAASVLRIGTIATVTAGAAADGFNAVTVTVRGSTIDAPYLDSYSPTLGDLVAVLLVDNAPLILGVVVGLPLF